MTDSPVIDAGTLFALRALVDGTRLRIVARLAAGPADAGTLAAELRQPVTAVSRSLEALALAGLVERREDRPGAFAARLDRVGELGGALAAFERAAAEASGALGPAGAWPHDGEPLADTLARLAPSPAEAKTLRSYLVDGRLTTIPAQEKKRRIVLRFLLERVFTGDRGYSEQEVNQRLALFHPDVASLRRYLVDGGYADRAGGTYRRRGPRPERATEGPDRDGRGLESDEVPAAIPRSD
jgi:DNA-binding transcriptional ArsR family regulator